MFNNVRLRLFFTGSGLLSRRLKSWKQLLILRVSEGSVLQHGPRVATVGQGLCDSPPIEHPMSIFPTAQISCGISIRKPNLSESPLAETCCEQSPSASGKAALSRWKNGVHPAGRRVPWPADLWSTAASSPDAVLEIVSLIIMWVLTTVREIHKHVTNAISDAGTSAPNLDRLGLQVRHALRESEGHAQQRRGAERPPFAHKWVDTNGAAARLIIFDRLGKKVRPGTFGNIKVGTREYPKGPSVNKT